MYPETRCNRIVIIYVSCSFVYMLYMIIPDSSLNYWQKVLDHEIVRNYNNFCAAAPKPKTLRLNSF